MLRNATYLSADEVERADAERMRYERVRGDGGFGNPTMCEVCSAPLE